MSTANAWPDGRWHYRRSLASRVAVLTTVALGLSIAVMAFTAFVVMRQQMMSSLDQSLLNRAHRATVDTTLSGVTTGQIPPWLLGAADIEAAVPARQALLAAALADSLIKIAATSPTTDRRSASGDTVAR